VSRRSSLLKFLEQEIPGTVSSKKVLVIPPAERILRGFLIENTAYRDLVHVWWLIAPLYTPNPFVPLTYGQRLSSGPNETHFRIVPESFVESATAVRDAIVSGEYIEHLQSIASPQDVLGHMGTPASTASIPRRLDYAMTLYLLGETASALRYVEPLAFDIDKESEQMKAVYGQPIKRALKCLKNDSAGLLSVLDEWQEANIAAFGLQRARLSMIGSHPHS
jgi:hypothetical protein